MTIEEFSNEFDVLLNSYAIAKNFGAGQSITDLDEYEKSVLLTDAQEQIVRELYNGRLTGEGFESTEEQRRALANLVKTDKIEAREYPVEQTRDIVKFLILSDHSTIFQLPYDLWFITYEAAMLSDDRLGCKNSSMAEVIPVRLDEYHKIKDNPFRGPSDKRVLRIDTGIYSYKRNLMIGEGEYKGQEDIFSYDIPYAPWIELISKYNVAYYFIKYIRRPHPIILSNIGEDNLSINGIDEKSEYCELNPSLHRLILERAVALAIKRMPSNKTNV